MLFQVVRFLLSICIWLSEKLLLLACWCRNMGRKLSPAVIGMPGCLRSIADVAIMIEKLAPIVLTLDCCACYPFCVTYFECSCFTIYVSCSKVRICRGDFVQSPHNSTHADTTPKSIFYFVHFTRSCSWPSDHHYLSGYVVVTAVRSSPSHHLCSCRKAVFSDQDLYYCQQQVCYDLHRFLLGFWCSSWFFKSIWQQRGFF